MIEESLNEKDISKKKLIAFSKEELKLQESQQRGFLISSEIPDDLLRYDWQDYKFDNNEQVDDSGEDLELHEDVQRSRRNAWKACGYYCKNMLKMDDDENTDYPFASILLMGTKGSGKSVLGSLILREAMKRLNEKVLYVSFGNLVVECSTPSWVNHREDLEETYCSPKMLMIDEVCDGHFINIKAQSYINHILTKRANWRHPTIITSKVSYDSLFHILGFPSHSLIGKLEIYNHISIINTEITSPEKLLSAETSYPEGKVKMMIQYLEEIRAINKKRRMSVGLHGDQMRFLLERCLRGGSFQPKHLIPLKEAARGYVYSKQQQNAEIKDGSEEDFVKDIPYSPVDYNKMEDDKKKKKEKTKRKTEKQKEKAKKTAGEIAKDTGV